MIQRPGRKTKAAASALLAAAFLCGEAHAWAWPMPNGEGQAILKYEEQTALRGFDAEGLPQAMDAEREELVSLWVEHGVSERLTVQGKFSWTRGQDALRAYEGRGPTELGVRYAFVNRPATVFSVYAGASLPGEGRNSRYLSPEEAGTDMEVRLLVGRSARLLDRPLFGELQLARIERQNLPSENRFDTTFGWTPFRNWLLMTQTYAGEAHTPSVQHLWLNGEVSVVRTFGDWRVQGGWRRTLGGLNVPEADGPVLAVWRTF